MGYFYSPRLARRIRQELETVDYDLIFVHCTFAALYVVGAEIPSILDFGDMDSQKWLAYSKVRQFPLSLAYYLDGQKLRWAEARLATNFDLCTCTTRAELKTLETYNVGVPLGWFPNGVDSDYYPNQECMIDFCHNILSLIRAKRPNVTFTIVGAAPPRPIRNLGRQPAVTVTGSVPDIRIDAVVHGLRRSTREETLIPSRRVSAPSRTVRGHAGHAPFEAISMERMVLRRNVGGPVELIRAKDAVPLYPAINADPAARRPGGR